MDEAQYAAVLRIGRLAPRVVRLHVEEAGVSVDDGGTFPTKYREPRIVRLRRPGRIRIHSPLDGELHATVLGDDEPESHLKPGMHILRQPGLIPCGGALLLIGALGGAAGKQARQTRADRRLATDRLAKLAATHHILIE